MINELVVATHNQGKVEEFKVLMKDLPIEIKYLADFDAVEAPAETGRTFAANARQKATYYAKKLGKPCIADDSGLEVDALNGAPGVYSARYSDDWESLPGESRDARNIRKLLHAMGAVPAEKRGCRFVSCMAAAKPNGDEMVVRGTWEGILLESPHGDNGFGYDPIFFDPSARKSAAELTRDEKNARSHRGNALRALLARWAEFMR